MRLAMLRLALWTGFLLRFFVAIWNGFFGPSYGAGSDSLLFHLAAVKYSNNLVLDHFMIGHIYSYFLGVFYFFTTDSLFLGSFLSVVAWLLSALILVRIMRMLSINYSNQYKAMFIYALLPSSILLTSITLRESYQLLFVNIAIYSALKIYLHKSITIHWLSLICAIAVMAVLHGALFISSLFILIATLFLLSFRKGLSLFKITLVVPIVFLCLYYGFLLFTSISYNLNDGLDVAVQSFQEGSISSYGRATYRTDVSIDGMIDLIFSVPVFLLQYLFEPMPWRMSSLIDVVSLVENFLRVWLIWRALKYFLHTSEQNRKSIAFIFLTYVVMETIWSLGTSNWGTSMRHHLPSIGLLLVVAFAYQGKLVNRLKGSML
jgi:hypothetical protein